MADARSAMVKSRVGVFIATVFVGLALLTGAVGWAYAEDLGSSPGYSCYTRPAPAGYPPEGSFFSERTLIPLGTSCEFALTQGTGVVQPDPDWGPTYVAGAGIALIVGGLVYIGRGGTKRSLLERV